MSRMAANNKDTLWSFSLRLRYNSYATLNVLTAAVRNRMLVQRYASERENHRRLMTGKMVATWSSKSSSVGIPSTTAEIALMISFPCLVLMSCRTDGSSGAASSSNLPSANPHHRYLPTEQRELNGLTSILSISIGVSCIRLEALLRVIYVLHRLCKVGIRLMPIK